MNQTAQYNAHGSERIVYYVAQVDENSVCILFILCTLAYNPNPDFVGKLQSKY